MCVCVCVNVLYRIYATVRNVKMFASISPLLPPFVAARTQSYGFDFSATIMRYFSVTVPPAARPLHMLKGGQGSVI